MISSEWIAAGAAVAAAIIGPLAAIYIGNKQNRTAAAVAQRQIDASLISASRQAWIEKLRDTIAEFLSVSLNLGYRGGHSYAIGEDEERLEKAAFLRARILLLVNPTEPDHKELVALLDTALSLAYAAGSDARKEMAITQHAITEVSQRILKREWTRVKAGESETRELPRESSALRISSRAGDREP